MILWLVPLTFVFIAGLNAGLPWLVALSGGVMAVAAASIATWAIRHEAGARRLRATSMLESDRWQGGRTKIA